MLSTIWSIVQAVIVFGLIIFVHELGHFIVAKLSKITVLEFTIGFGPAIIKKKYKGTLYALRIIPLGGAVMMEGADEEEEILKGNKPDFDKAKKEAEYKEGSYLNAPKWKRFLVSVAGPLMNIIFGVIIIFFVMGGVDSFAVPTIDHFMDGYEFESEEYIMPGDTIKKINDVNIYLYSDINLAFAMAEMMSDPVGPFDIVVERDGKKVYIEDMPLYKGVIDEETGTEYYGFVYGTEAMTFGGRINYTVNSSLSIVQSVIKSLQLLFTGNAGPQDMMGTVGIAGEIADRSSNPLEMWYFVAFISINVAFMNLLPIPALDGGKILFILIELVRGKKVSPKVEGYASLVSLVLILGLFLVITYFDISRLVGG